MKSRLSLVHLALAGALVLPLTLSFAAELCLESPVNYATGSASRPVVAADLDGDLDADLAIGNWNTGTISILLNDGTGGFTSIGTHPVGTNPISVDAADLDGDGDEDLAIANWGSNDISILYNNGNATFAPAVAISAGTGVSWVIAADLNDDDSLDLAMTNWGDNNVVVMLYIGEGDYSTPVPYAVGTNPWEVCSADLDGDGDPDLATANGTTNNISVLLNNGDGTFQTPTHFGVGLVPTSLIACDLDGDLDFDLTAANYDSHNVSVLNNNGDGTFAVKVDYPVGSIPRSVRASDLDADGDRDLITANYGSNNGTVLRNNGDGTFSSPSNFSVGSFPISAFGSNLDGDAYGDLAIVNYGSNNVSVIINCLHIPTTLHIPQDYPTIQAGIDAAVDGDTVLVAPGTYSEHLNISGRALYLVGRGGADSTIVQPLVAGLSLLRAEDAPSSTVVEGFTFSGINTTIPGEGAAVLLNNCGSPVLRRNVLTDNSGCNYALLVKSCNATISSNLIIRNDVWSAVGIESSQPCILANNNIVLNIAIGIYISSANGVILSSNIVAFNSSEGIYRYQGTIVLSHNDVYDNSIDYFGLVPDTGSISMNPLFCDTTVNDFALATNSPCVGTGEGGNDIGAYGVGCTTPAPEAPAVQRIGIALPGDSLHVTNATPPLSWKYFDQQSRPHTMSEIEVGTDADWTAAEMWQPPTIIGPDTSIVYSGLPLLDGATYYIRVRVFNDTLWSNWLVAPFRMNSVPTAPPPISPSNGSIVLSGTPTLEVMNATDSEGDTKRYDFFVYTDSNLSQLASWISGKVEGFALTLWKSDSLVAENQRHWWRARANDGYENGPWSEFYTFTVDGYNEPPSPVQLIEIADAGTTSDLTPDFVWARPVDPDPNPSVTYKLVLGLDPGFTFKSELTGITDTTPAWPSSLNVNQSYWWKA